MGIFSPTASIVKYKVEGEIESSIIQTVEESLKKNTIIEIEENTTQELSIGWTSTHSPFNPYFEDSSFLVGSYFIFSLRIDKKKIPAQLLKKKLDQEIKKRLKETGQEFIAKGLKQRIKEQITEILLMKIDPTPSVYDLIWDYENEELYFYSTQKAANEELETLFAKTFGFTLINLFPFTIAELDLDLNTMEKEKLHNLLPFIIEA